MLLYLIYWLPCGHERDILNTQPLGWSFVETSLGNVNIQNVRVTDVALFKPYICEPAVHVNIPVFAESCNFPEGASVWQPYLVIRSPTLDPKLSWLL